MDDEGEGNTDCSHQNHGWHGAQLDSGVAEEGEQLGEDQGEESDLRKWKESLSL